MSNDEEPIITIYQDDLPIEIASKFIKATIPRINLLGDTINCVAYTSNDLNEIADYLLAYCHNHIKEYD